MEKLFTAEYDDPIFRYGCDAAQRYLSGIVELDAQDTVRDIQVITRAGLWLKIGC